MTQKKKINIIIAGSGVFGTALAERLAWNAKNQILLYSRDEVVVNDINNNHQNKKSYPTRFLKPSIKAFSDIEKFSEADYIFLAIPSKAIISFTEEIEEYIKKDTLVINLAKGMNSDGTFITDHIHESVSMKGPTFAIELLNGFPSAFTVGGSIEDYHKIKNDILPSTMISIDYTTDAKAVELLSVLKNMYAIAIGLVSGRYNSPNVDFLIYTKAVNEMRKFLQIFNCKKDTIFKYCGIGDLGLTSLNDLSRNRTLGLLIGKGFIPDVTNNSSTIVEGYRTVKLMYERVNEQNMTCDFPIVTALYFLLYGKATINDYLETVFN
ncbi:MAG: NAD(P)-binding domain-containing protein [Spirochaetaceae bacterium]|nr:NAD(P)-binding domain-containing protein [Spirochaetaceae bacterium]